MIVRNSEIAFLSFLPVAAVEFWFTLMLGIVPRDIAAHPIASF